MYIRYITSIAAAFWLAGCACSVLALEFDTSTGQEDVVFMSTEGEANLGDSLARRVEKKFPLVEDEDAQKRVSDIGQRIAAVCDRKDITYHFALIKPDEEQDEPVINAFALPGGYVYVFKDLYDKAETDDELAGVIAHEVGHIVGRHSVKKMQTALGSNILVILGAQTNTTRENVGRAMFAIHQLMMAYSREDEVFADKMSVKYTKKAGYDPEGVAIFLSKLLKMQKEKPIRRHIFGKTHPYLSVRIPKVRQEIHGTIDFVDYINIPTETQERR